MNGGFSVIFSVGGEVSVGG
jgi:hypothetical protein